MKLLKIRIENLPFFEAGTEIDFLAEGRVSESEKHELIHLFKNFYLNRTLTFTGLNAAGKTQILNVLSFVMNLIQAKPINSHEFKFLSDRSNSLNLGIGQKGKLEIYFYSGMENEELINKLEVEVIRKKDSSDDEYKYFIEKEVLFRKNIAGIRSKKDIYNFDLINEKKIEVIDRNSENFLALSSDVSLLNVFYNLKKYKKLYYRDMIVYTDFNMLSSVADIPTELIQFLDPSIELLKFKIVEKSGAKDLKVDIKFKGQKKVMTLDTLDLDTMLSSGTIKGLGLFMNAISTLQNGGVILIDELENHFNREIALTLIHLFTDRKINLEGAILIYTTHYAELLDTLDRNDSIYIVTKDGKIGLKKLSDELKRKDIKRSEQFIKGILSHTAPKYDAEMKLKRVIKEKVKREKID